MRRRNVIGKAKRALDFPLENTFIGVDANSGVYLLILLKKAIAPYL
jgi:hypothetical protein